MPEMESVKGERSIFYACLCKKAEKHWQGLFYGQLQWAPCTVSQSGAPFLGTRLVSIATLGRSFSLFFFWQELPSWKQSGIHALAAVMGFGDSCLFSTQCTEYRASSVIWTSSVVVDLRSVQISEFVRKSEIHLCQPFSLRIFQDFATIVNRLLL